MKQFYQNIVILSATLLLLAVALYLFHRVTVAQDNLTTPQKSVRVRHKRNTMISEIKQIQATGLSTPHAYHDGNRVVYGKKSWQYIGPRFVKIKGVEQECLWVHPEEKPISFTWNLKKSHSVKISFIPIDTIDKTTSLKVTYKLTRQGQDEGFSLRITPKNGKTTNTFTKGPYDTITVTLTASKTAKNHWCMQGKRW